MKLAIALVLLPVAFIVVFFVAGVTGVLFYLWPTSLNDDDERIDMTVIVIERSRPQIKKYPSNPSNKEHDDEERIDMTVAKVDGLQALLKERKFVEDRAIPYPGAMNEASRAAAQSAVDSLLKDLLAKLPIDPRRAVLLREFKRTLTSFDTIESEERDRLLVYLKQIMDILGVKSFAELLNV